MSNNIQVQARTSILARIRNGLKTLGRDRRGAELVEVLVVIALFALAGVTAMEKLGSTVNTTANTVAGKISGLQKFR